MAVRTMDLRRKRVTERRVSGSSAATAARLPRTKTATCVSNKQGLAVTDGERHPEWRCKIKFWQVQSILSKRDGLEKLFSIYNEIHFGGKLPSVRVNWSRDETRQGRFGSVHRDSGAIAIASDLRRYLKFAASTLLHEMCHLCLKHSGFKRNLHGSAFQAQMLRLANKGAFHELW
jgi:hypothetical protein